LEREMGARDNAEHGVIPGERHVLAVMGFDGDTKTTWDPRVKLEVDEAREYFERLQKKGYMFYRVDEDGEKGELMRSFDPKAACMIASPKVVGG
jgi:IMP cyclohydrolase